MRRLFKGFLLLIFFNLAILYSFLAFKHVVPSIFHVPLFRRFWDTRFAQCENDHHRQLEFQNQNKNLYLGVSPKGRFANRMFQHASLIGIAKQNERTPFVRIGNPLLNVFEMDDILTLGKSNYPSCVDSIQDELPCKYDRKMERLPNKNLTLDGYLQSWKYFKDYEKEIRKKFRFKSYYLETAENILNDHISKQAQATALYISVHVRRTDMMIPSSTRLGFKEAPLEYILNAMKYMRNKFNETLTFVVVSEDDSWCRQFLNFKDVMIIPENTKEVDMAILSKCNHSIITTGTYGWWGAWLAGGHTVYYSNYPERGSKLDKEMDKKDFYPPDWVAIDTASFVYFGVSTKLVIFIVLLIHLFV